MNFYWCKLLIYVVSMIIIVRSVWYTYVKRLSFIFFNTYNFYFKKRGGQSREREKKKKKKNGLCSLLVTDDEGRQQGENKIHYQEQDVPSNCEVLTAGCNKVNHMNEILSIAVTVS